MTDTQTNGHYDGAPAQTQRSGPRGERRSGEVSEFLPSGRNEGYGARDAAPEPPAPAAAPNPDMGMY